MQIDVDLSAAPSKAPKCCECGARTRIATGEQTYPTEPELWARPMWLCGCGAYARCSPGTLYPIGVPASKETRQVRSACWSAYRELRAIYAGDGAFKDRHKREIQKEFRRRAGFGIIQTSLMKRVRAEESLRVLRDMLDELREKAA